MKSFICHVLFAVILLSHKTYASQEDVVFSDVIQEVSERRELTPEEEVLANEARAEIADAIQHNLIRIFAIITAQNEHPYVRQEDDGDDVDISVTPNPNVLPQVAQILGAIFSGSLNITRIVDSTVGLVPNLVRNQLQGLVKLLTGENVNLSGASTTTSSSKSVDSSTSDLDILFEAEEATPTSPVVQAVTTEKVISSETTEVPSSSTSDSDISTTTGKNRYRVSRNKTRRTTTVSPLATNLVDDEVERIERDIIAAGRLFEPYEQNKEPRFYAGMFDAVLQNVNMTEIAKAVPTIFKGATQAFTLLENLGLVDTLPGADVLEDLEIGLEQEE